MKKSEKDALYGKLPKLKPSIKKRWLAALRSGEYKQGHAALCNANKEEGKVGFCCLGVLCDVVKDDKAVKVDWEFTPYIDDPKGGYWEFDGNGTYLSPFVQQHAFGEVVADEYGDDVLAPLIKANDGDTYYGVKGKTFAQIATIIEEYM